MSSAEYRNSVMRARVDAGPDHLMVMEGHSPVADRTRLGLADVVEEGGEAQEPVRSGLVDHRQGVGEHVFVSVDWVLFEGEAGQFGQEVSGQAGAHDEPQRL